MDPTIRSDVQVVGAGLNYDIRPAVGEVWELTRFGSSVFVGVPPNLRPDMNVGIFDGITGPSHTMRGADVRGWYRDGRLIIDNTHYARITNAAGAGANLSFSAKLIREVGAGPSPIRSDVQAVLAAGTVDIRPAAGSGETWKITDIGSDQWIGAAGVALPDVDIDLNDGTLTARILRSPDNRGWQAPLEFYVDRNDYITITNTAGVTAAISWSAELVHQSGTGVTLVRSDIQTALALASVDFRPVLGEEWKITGIAGAAWVGVAPAGVPDLTAHLFDLANASQIMDSGGGALQNSLLQLLINNANYLRLTDTSNAPHNVGISAILTGQYST